MSSKLTEYNPLKKQIYKQKEKTFSSGTLVYKQVRDNIGQSRDSNPLMG